MVRPPHAASLVVGYAQDAASAVVKMEPNSNRMFRISRDWPSLLPLDLGWRIGQNQEPIGYDFAQIFSLDMHWEFFKD